MNMDYDYFTPLPVHIRSGTKISKLPVNTVRDLSIVIKSKKDCLRA